MIINNKLRTLFVLALHIGFTIAIYAIVCHFLKIEFQDIHLLYAILVGCVAYLPRFIAEKKSKKKKDKQGEENAVLFFYLRQQRLHCLSQYRMHQFGGNLR